MRRSTLAVGACALAVCAALPAGLLWAQSARATKPGPAPAGADAGGVLGFAPAHASAQKALEARSTP